jgi:hypothetical protein
LATAVSNTWLLAIAKFRAMSAHSEYRQREEAFDEAAAAKLVDHNDTPDVVMEQKTGRSSYAD